MPFEVKVQVKQSNIHGRGVFAAEDILKGSPIWTFNKTQKSIPPIGFPQTPIEIYNEEQFDKILDSSQRIDVLMHGYPHKWSKKLMRADAIRFINHSQNPNMEVIHNQDYRLLKTIATKDIKQGEEIVQDYKTFDNQIQPWIVERFKKYYPERLKIINYK